MKITNVYLDLLDCHNIYVCSHTVWIYYVYAQACIYNYVIVSPACEEVIVS